MPWRTYPNTGNYGTVACLQRRWINSNKPYRPQKRGLERKSIWSKRFGFIDLYSRKERESLICPSGYSVAQGFGALRRLWFGYLKEFNSRKNMERATKYAKKIQEVQEDMGIETASFPHLGLYGDSFVLYDKLGKRIVFEDHSALKEKQKEYEKWQEEQAKDSKKIQEKLQKPDKEKGEDLETFADDVSPADVNLAYEEDAVPDLLQAQKQEGEEVVTMTDDIPFQTKWKRERTN